VKKTVKKITLSKETLLRLEPEYRKLNHLAGGDNTGPSCAIFKGCTLAGWDC
jgi:hypothetical protein